MAEINPVIKASVLRVKRKRTEDPYEVLLIHNASCKKSRDETIVDDKGLFQLACSVNFDGGTSVSDVESIIQKHHETRQPANAALKPSRINEIRDAIRLERREVQSKERFKVVLDQRNINQEAKSVAVESGYRVFDVIRNDGSITPSTISKPSVDSTIRKMEECLDLKDESHTEYVHDYYVSNEPYHAIDESCFEVEPIAEDYWLDILHYQKHHADNQMYDDDDDSNDENNWRNDYPEEDPGLGSDSDVSSSSDDDDNLFRCNSSRQAKRGQFDYDKYNYENFDDYGDSSNHFADDFYGE